MTSIEELLHRRSDLSTFLVHLTRDTATDTARENLLSITASNVIEARSPLGMAATYDPILGDGIGSQRVACFTETPLEHTWMLTEDIDNRAIQFSRYGLVFTKTTARKRGCNPVWYIDISQRGADWLTNPVNELVQDAVTRSTVNGVIEAEKLSAEPIIRMTPFLEQMGPTSTGRKEFWWEREWRHVRDFQFFPSKVVAVLAPEHDHDALHAFLTGLPGSWARRPRPVLDPRWGLERMLASMSGIDPDEFGPFPDAN